MSKNKEYKPIMIIYLQYEAHRDFVKNESNIDNLKAKYGYPVIFMSVDSGDKQRVEIISVDKATVVEDIQKYIDLKLEEKEEFGLKEMTEVTQTYLDNQK